MKGLENHLTNEPDTRERNEWRNSIHLGDCFDIMKMLPDQSVDLILCDLPYGTTACKWDIVLPFEKLWAEYKRIAKMTTPIVLFGSEPFSSELRISNIEKYKYDWVWDKRTARGHLVAKIRPMQQTETISVFGYGKINYYPQMLDRPEKMKKNSREYSRTDIVGGGTQHKEKIVEKEYTQWYPKNLITFSAANTSNDKFHPTAKPLALLQYLIKTYTKEGDIILDNCMGSGSTCVAAKNTDRIYIGIEKEEKYFKVAEQRLNGKLF